MITTVTASISDALIKNKHFDASQVTMRFADNTTGTLSLIGHINYLLIWNVPFTVTYSH